MAHDRELQQALAHVLWIGGTPDSGKTSIADMLASRYGLQVYHFDRHEVDHFARLDPERQPALQAAHPDNMTPEQRWILPSPEESAGTTIASWTERFGMVVEDLLDMTDSSGIIAEGPGFFPECVAPMISGHRKAVWLVPSEPFLRASVARRGKPGNRHETSDPELATRNLIERNLLMGAHVRRKARDSELSLYEVDGTKSLDEVAALVEAHFAPYLSASD